MQKPLLPLWYEIGGTTIKSRTTRILNCEIYQLTDKKYLYVFVDIKEENLIAKKISKYEMIPISIWLGEYTGIIMDTFDSGMVEKLKKDVTQNIGFESISGMQDLKTLLYNEVILPLREPEKFKKYKLSIPNGILFFGPPWCGKTFISRKLAEEVWYNFYEIKHSDIASPFIHGSTGKIGEVFAIAKANKPSIVFLDEISGLVPKRDELSGSQQYKEEEVNELLMQLSDAGKNQILVIGATNYPDRIDSAIMRSGRMDKRIFIWPPDFDARKELFRLYLSERPTKNIDYAELARLTLFYVTADIEGLCDNFARKALALGWDIIMEICLECISNFKASLTKEQLDYHQTFMESYQRM
jgi:transitional endoplasmic reticulum ATPase